MVFVGVGLEGEALLQDLETAGAEVTPAFATLRPPQALDQGTVSPTQITCPLLNSQPSPFVPAPTQKSTRPPVIRP